MFVIWSNVCLCGSNVCYVVKCLLCGQMSVMWLNVCHMAKCLLYGQMSVIWLNVGNMDLNVGNMVKCR